MESTSPDFTAEWIWGDDAETTVFAQGYGNDHTVIFSFSLEESKPLTSLANRICNSFHAIEVPEAESFPSSADMRASLWNAVRALWPACLQDDSISRMDTIIAVDSQDSTTEHVTWKAYSHPWFPRYLEILADPHLGRTTSDISHSVPFESLIRYEQLGGHGCATRVRLDKDAKDFHVFKGIDFRTFLAQSDDEGDSAIKHTVWGWHNSNTLLMIMPPHLNILPQPLSLVTVRHGNKEIACGTIQPLYKGGNVGSSIERSNFRGQRLPLELKAHWCANMAAALLHTHRVAKTYHMDIKPGNFLIDEHQNLVLCDWEQTDAPCTTLTPEADGSWDVIEEGDEAGSEETPATSRRERPRFRYTKYDGPPRRNVPEDALGDASWHAWNVFPLWNKAHPFALELAEVFSLGRTMWMLLRQPDMEFDDVGHPNDLKTDWTSSDDVPELWKDFVDRCMAVDPNSRHGIVEVSRFWEREWQMLEETPTTTGNRS
ncbi:hypothetical protein F5Y13DRAFT_158119 [Hypoxylon sp. FL1857]|nr:hypothetical protein F5Y13DRAFT_158119 [Hypoxylon sp. FL1857]